MKLYKILPLLLTLCLLPQAGWSVDDFNNENLSLDQLTPEPSPNDIPDSNRGPFSFKASYDVVGTAKITKGWFKHEKVRFAEAEVEGAFVFYYDPIIVEGANASLTYTATKIHWQDNLYFDQDVFQVFSLSLGAFTQRVDNWVWRALFSMNFNESGKNFTGEYISYDILLWGHYPFNDCINIHTGFIGETGMRLDKAWPILGFDWQISQKWKLNLVYPTNISITYEYTPHWTFGLAGRVFYTRNRAKRDEGRWLVRYENTGAEFLINYAEAGVSYNLHAGTTFGGKLRISNRSNHHPKTYKLSSEPYIGGEVDVKF